MTFVVKSAVKQIPTNHDLGKASDYSWVRQLTNNLIFLHPEVFIYSVIYDIIKKNISLLYYLFVVRWSWINEPK